MKWIFTLVALALSAVATSVNANRILASGTGHSYAVEQSERGAILRSLAPITRFDGDARPIFRGTEVIYLGADCDAFSEFHGAGFWEWANGGFFIRFDTMSLVFPRHDHPVDAAGTACRL